MAHALTRSLDDAASGLCCTFAAPVDYTLAVELQQALVDLVADGTLPSTLLLLSHPLVATLGRGASVTDAAGAAAPVVRSHRGGRITVHGPGQVVGYLILNLRAQHLSVHGYVRRLEQWMMAVCRDFGVFTEIRDGLTGLWTTRGKIGSIGIAVRRGITWHGFALYVTDQRDNFGMLNPCALPGVVPDSLAAHVEAITPQAVEHACLQQFGKCFDIPSLSHVRMDALDVHSGEIHGRVTPLKI